MLAPPRWKTVCSYITGWLTSLAWIATIATESLFAGLMLEGIVILNHPEYTPKQYQGTFITWAVIAVCIFINVVIPAWLPRLEVFTMVFHIAGFFAILVTLLVVTNPRASTSDVWLTTNNSGGWPTQGLSYCVGFLGNVSSSFCLLTTLVTAHTDMHCFPRSQHLSEQMRQCTWPKRSRMPPGICREPLLLLC